MEFLSAVSPQDADRRLYTALLTQNFIRPTQLSLCHICKVCVIAPSGLEWCGIGRNEWN